MVTQQWFAAYTYPRHEKKVAEYLRWSGVESFLPVYKEASSWKNGLRVLIERPLFPSYIFVHIDASESLKILRVPSVASLVTVAGVPASLPNCEIESLKAGVSQLNLEPHPYIRKGDRVRVKSGPFAGQEGILALHKNRWRVVICIELLMQAISVEIESSAIERLPANLYRCVANR
jgi:transcription antitermination factor NusG